MNEEQARRHILQLKGFYSHLASFVAVNLFLLMINVVEWQGDLWAIYPISAWGVGLFIHWATVFLGGRDWEARKMEELTGYRQTQDELERLSERTETLIAILSDLNWEKVDPELVATRDELHEARDRIVSMRRSGQQTGEAELKDKIEKLEEFVTSPRFEYYDKASRGDG